MEIPYTVKWESEGQKELNDSIKALNESFKGFTGSAGKAKDETKKTGDETEEAAKKTTIWTRDIRNLGKEMRDASSSKFPKMSKGISTFASGAKAAFGLVAIGVGVAIGALTAFTAASVKLSQAGSEQQMLDLGLIQSYQAMGMSLADAKVQADALSGSIGTLTLGFGAIAGDEKLIKAMTLYTLKTRDAVGATTALNNMLKISKVSGQDINTVQAQYSTAVAKGGKELQTFLGVSKQQAAKLTAMTSVTERAAEINSILAAKYKDVSLAGNDAASQLARFNNAIGGDLQQALGGAINDTGVFQAILGPLSKRFEDLQGWIKGNSATIKTWALNFADGFATAIDVGAAFGQAIVVAFTGAKLQFTATKLAFNGLILGVKIGFNALVDVVVGTADLVLNALEKMFSALQMDETLAKIKSIRAEIKTPFKLDVQSSMDASLANIEEMKTQAREGMATVDAIGKAASSLSSDIRIEVAGARVTDTTQKASSGGPTKPTSPNRPTGKGDDAAKTQAAIDAAAKKALDDQNKLIDAYHAEVLIRMKIETLSTKQSEMQKAIADAANRQYEIENNRSLSPQERELRLLEEKIALNEELATINKERLTNEATAQAKINKDLQTARDAQLATQQTIAALGSSISDKFIKDEKKKAVMSGAIEGALGIANFAAYAGSGFLDQSKLVASINHGIASAAFFSAAGKGGGTSKSGGGSGSSGGSSGSSASPQIDSRKSQEDLAKSISKAISDSTRAASERNVVVNINNPTMLSEAPQMKRDLAELLKPELRAVLLEQRR